MEETFAHDFHDETSFLSESFLLSINNFGVLLFSLPSQPFMSNKLRKKMIEGKTFLVSTNFVPKSMFATFSHR